METSDVEQIELEYVGIDDWSRPVFKMPGTRMFFGSTEKLFNCNIEKAELLAKLSLSDLCYFGDSFNCEPMGGVYLDNDKVITMKSGRRIHLVLQA